MDYDQWIWIRMTHHQQFGGVNFISSAVLRSQSFHSGVGQFNNLQLRQQFSEDSFNKNRWTSTESSDEEEFGETA